MLIDETQNQDNIATIIADDDAEAIDNTPDWGEPSTKYGRYGEPTGHNYVRRPVCGAEVPDGEMSTASH